MMRCDIRGASTIHGGAAEGAWADEPEAGPSIPEAGPPRDRSGAGSAGFSADSALFAGAGASFAGAGAGRDRDFFPDAGALLAGAGAGAEGGGRAGPHAGAGPPQSPGRQSLAASWRLLRGAA